MSNLSTVRPVVNHIDLGSGFIGRLLLHWTKFSSKVSNIAAITSFLSTLGYITAALAVEKNLSSSISYTNFRISMR